MWVMPANAGGRGACVAMSRRQPWGGEGHWHMLHYVLLGDILQLLGENLLAPFHPQVEEEEDLHGPRPTQWKAVP